MLPKKLQKGDKVAIIASGKKISKTEIEKAISIYESWGLEVFIGKTIDAEYGYLAGDDELRKVDLQFFINQEDIKAIFFARGGYGMVRIIDEIDFTLLLKNPKWLVGFSDVTVLHSHLHKNYSFPTVHGIMPVFFENATPESVESLRKLLFKGKMEYEFKSEYPEYCKNGEITAPIVGGNLSILYALCGSNSSINTNGKILFIEDLCEYLYHTDRMLQNLKRNGFFNNIKGLIVGDFSDMKDGNPPFAKNVQALIFDYVKDLNIPVFTNFPSGHFNNNQSLLLGEKVHFSVNNDIVKLIWNNNGKNV